MVESSVNVLVRLKTPGFPGVLNTCMLPMKVIGLGDQVTARCPFWFELTAFSNPWRRLMAYDDGLACRLNEIYTAIPGVVDKKMFGGLAFMVNGHMSCGIVNDTLMVRVGPDLYEKALGRPYARPMDFTGKPMKGFVYVAPEGFESDEELMSWVQLSLDFVMSLPPK